LYCMRLPLQFCDRVNSSISILPMVHLGQPLCWCERMVRCESAAMYSPHCAVDVGSRCCKQSSQFLFPSILQSRHVAPFFTVLCQNRSEPKTWVAFFILIACVDALLCIKPAHSTVWVVFVAHSEWSYRQNCI
jgi:hypothetical protein